MCRFPRKLILDGSELTDAECGRGSGFVYKRLIGQRAFEMDF